MRKPDQFSLLILRSFDEDELVDEDETIAELKRERNKLFPRRFDDVINTIKQKADELYPNDVLMYKEEKAGNKGSLILTITVIKKGVPLGILSNIKQFIKAVNDVYRCQVVTRVIHFESDDGEEF
jgi:hypothetical protein